MGLGVGGNYVWCLVIVVIFMEFGRAKKWEDVLKSSLEVERQATKGGEGWAVFMGTGGSYYVIMSF